MRSTTVLAARLRLRLRDPRVASLLVAAALAACTRDPAPAPSPAPVSSATADASSSLAASRPPQPAPTDAADGGLLARKLPRIEYRGGPFIRHPRVVTVTFSKDDPKLTARIEQFGTTITRTSWWRTVVEGYCAKPDECIGDGSAAPPVHLDEVLPAHVKDTDVEALLLRTAKAGRLGSLDASTVVLVYLPPGVTLGDSTVPRYCEGNARAFHRSLEIEKQRVAIAVMPRCGDEAELTGTASHELLEATTNPFPSERGFAFVGGSGPSGFTAAGFEPVDPCGLVTMDRHWTTESGFVVHRAWSNRAASLAHDPCVPARAEAPYVMLVPRAPAVRLPRVGEVATIVLDASADRTSPPWAISAFDLSGYHDHAQYVELTLDKSTVGLGESVTLTVKSLKQNPQQRGIVAIVSTLGVHSHMWPLLVMMR